MERKTILNKVQKITGNKPEAKKTEKPEAKRFGDKLQENNDQAWGERRR